MQSMEARGIEQVLWLLHNEQGNCSRVVWETASCGAGEGSKGFAQSMCDCAQVKASLACCSTEHALIYKSIGRKENQYNETCIPMFAPHIA